MSEKRGPGRRPNPTPPQPKCCYDIRKAPFGWSTVLERHYIWDRSIDNTRNLSQKTVGYLPPGCTDVSQMVSKEVFTEAVREARERERAEKEAAAQAEPKDVAVAICTRNIIPFSDMRDPEKVIYPAYLVLLVLMMCTGLGYSSNRQIAEFWRAYREDLSRVFPDFPERDISHDTVRNFFIALGKLDINMLMGQFNAMLLLEAGIWEDIRKNASPEERAAFQRSVLALDGQAVRASKITVGKDRAKCCLSVFDTTYSVVLGQALVGKKTNEIPHARELVRKIDIKGSIITADAMHTQLELLLCIIEAEADYCMPVKANQSGLMEDIRGAFNAPRNEHLVKSCSLDDKGHGRHEGRAIYVLPASVLAPELLDKWPGLANGSIAVVTSRRLEDAKDKKTNDTRYFISSLSYELDWIATWLLYIIRRHWCIENKLHWVLDVTYGQDYVQSKNDEYLNGVLAVNKLMYNFASAAQAALSKERKEKVSMRSIKPYFGSITAFLKLLGKIIVGAQEGVEDAENGKPARLPAP